MDSCRVWPGAEIHSSGGYVDIGDYCLVNPNTIIYGSGGVKIGDYVRIATQLVIIASYHIFDRTDIPIKCKDVNLSELLLKMMFGWSILENGWIQWKAVM